LVGLYQRIAQDLSKRLDEFNFVFNYQEGEVWDPIIKRRRFGIPLSRGGGLGSHYQDGEVWDPIIKRGVWDPIN
jgi:hypothetical protein